MKAKKTEPLEKKEKLYLYTDLYYLLSGSLDEASLKILDLEKRLRSENTVVISNPNMFKRFEIEYKHYDDSPEIQIYGIRMETDEEVKARLDFAKRKKEVFLRAKKDAETKERELYERLKKKFDETKP